MKHKPSIKEQFFEFLTLFKDPYVSVSSVLIILLYLYLLFTQP